MNTQEEYSTQFNGTLTYYPYKNGYAYTDAIKFLKSKMTSDTFDKVIDECIDFMGFKYLFGFFTLHVTDTEIYITAKDDEGDIFCTSHLLHYAPSEKDNYTTLDNGEYKIWIQNYVVFGASEY